MVRERVPFGWQKGRVVTLSASGPSSRQVAALVGQNVQLAGGVPTGARVPGDVVPGDVVPGDVVPGDIVPGDIVPGDVAPGDVAPRRALAIHTAVEGQVVEYQRLGAFDERVDHPREGIGHARAARSGFAGRVEQGSV